MEKTKVYKLVCKNTPNIVYVGVTKLPLMLRLFKHFAQCLERPKENIRKIEWILGNWKEIDIILLYEAGENEDVYSLESNFALSYEKEGYIVLNSTYRKLSVFNNNGDLIGDFPSIKELSEKLEVDKTSIHRIINKNIPTKGYRIYSYNGKDKIDPFIVIKKGKKVSQYDIEWNHIKDWDNIQDASLAVVNIKKATGIVTCAKGITETAYGYRWKYTDKEYKKKSRYDCFSTNLKMIADFFNVKTDEEITEFSKKIRKFLKGKIESKIFQCWDHQRLLREGYKMNFKI